MGLIVPSSSWSNCTTNMTGTPGTDHLSLGTQITFDNTGKGSTTSIISSLGHDVEYLVIGFHGSASGDDKKVVDIMVDPAGGTSWGVLVPNLVWGCGADLTALIAPPYPYHFPIFIKAGSSIGARCMGAVGSTNVMIQAFGGNKNPSTWWCGTHIECLGVTEGNSTATAHTPGNSGSFSSWANIGSTQTGPSGAVQFGMMYEGTTVTNIAYHWQYGIASTQVGPTLWHANNNTPGSTIMSPGPVFYSAPHGTQWMARATASGTAQAHGVAVYVVH